MNRRHQIITVIAAATLGLAATPEAGKRQRQGGAHSVAADHVGAPSQKTSSNSGP